MHTINDKDLNTATVTVSYEIYSKLIENSKELRKLKDDFIDKVNKKRAEGECIFIDIGWFTLSERTRGQLLSIERGEFKETASLIENMKLDLSEAHKKNRELFKELHELKNKKKGIFS